ncbi:hypothetical protein M9H77_08381 [Catharanthus roseus]|uniref:Uncharacterized protein n=1 Tax=Catharanthus roseus TaxID=4058 RepID=A0ACC0BXM0_CATRO|nr:hypothetical protein M9H77_08381 [Catharanthus roseus]
MRKRNVTPSSPLISIASESGFHLLSRCRGLPIQQFQKYRVACDSEDGDGWELAMRENDEKLYSAIQACETNVLVPADINEEEGRNGGALSYEELIRRGFSIKWTPFGCSLCLESGGQCGVDSNQFRDERGRIGGWYDSIRSGNIGGRNWGQGEGHSSDWGPECGPQGGENGPQEAEPNVTPCLQDMRFFHIFRLAHKVPEHSRRLYDDLNLSRGPWKSLEYSGSL